MDIDFDITRDDLLAYLRESNTRFRVIRTTYLRGFLWGPAIGVVVVAILRAFEPASAALLVVLTSVLYSAVWHIMWPARLDSICRRILDEGWMRMEVGHHRIVLDSEGLRETADWGESFRKWHVVGPVTTTQAHVMVDIVGSGPVVVIPRKAFGDGRTETAFVDVVRQHARGGAAEQGDEADEAR